MNTKKIIQDATSGYVILVIMVVAAMLAGFRHFGDFIPLCLIVFGLLLLLLRAGEK